MAINCFDGVNLKIGDKTLEQLFKERTSGNPSELELIEIGTDLAMQYHESLFNELETLRKAVNPKAAKVKYQNPFDKEKLNKAKEEQNKQPQKEQVKVEQPKEEPVAEPAEKQTEEPTPQPTKAKELADKVRKLKIDLGKLSGGGMQSNVLGLPVAIWNGAMDIVATTIEAGGQVADAIKRGLNYIQKNHRGQWDKKSFNDQVMKELGVRGITVNGQDLIVKDVEPEFAETINGFYSDIEQSILDVSPTDKGTPQAWLKKIGTGEEAKWTGVTDWLNSLPKDQKLSRKELLGWLKENRIQVVEVVLGKEDYRNLPEYKEADQKAFEAANNKMVAQQKWWESKKDEDFDEIQRLDKELQKWTQIKQNIEKRKEKEGVTMFSQYQLEGQKENYKEVLVTLPSKKFGEDALNELADRYGLQEKSKELYGRRFAGLSHNEKQEVEFQTIFSNDKNKWQQFHKEWESKIEETRNKFSSTHFDEPNILVHLRMNERQDSEGNKVLFLEELQSDWGQKGKKEGFKDDATQKQWDDLEKQRQALWDEVNEKHKGQIVPPLLQQKINEVVKKQQALYQGLQTPSAPFVTDTNAWTKLGLKVALKEAVKQGVDKIVWTTGEQQNERYDLSKQVEKVFYEKHDDGTYYITVKDKKDGQLRDAGMQNIPENKLSDFVGKELAEKIINGEGRQGEGKMTRYKVFDGLDLKIGGRGMEEFYGKPDLVKKGDKWVNRSDDFTIKKQGDKYVVFDEKGKELKSFKQENEANKFKENYGLGIVGNVAKSLFKQEPKTVEIKITEDKFVYDHHNTTIEETAKAYILKDKDGNSLSSFSKEVGSNYPPGQVRKQKLLELARQNPDLRQKVTGNSTQHSITITPELKQEAETGLPLFKDIKGRGKEIANMLRKAKIKAGGLQSNIAGIPIAIYNAAIETIALALEGGATLTQAIQKAINKHKLNQQKGFNQKEFISKLEDATGEKFTDDQQQPPPPQTPKQEPKEVGVGEPSGIKKALVSQKTLQEVNLEKVSDKEMMSLGREIINSGEVKPRELVEKIISEKTGVLTPTEVVALITYKADLDNKEREIYEEINKKKEAGEDLGTLQVEAKEIERQIQDYEVMAVITAASQSMAFRLRQKMLDMDYNVITQIEKYKSKNNGVIPQDIENRFRELGKQIDELKKKLFEAESKIEKEAETDAVNNIKESVDRENSYTEEELNKKIQEGVDNEISKIYESLPEEKKSAADKAISALEKFRAKIKSRTYESTLGLPLAIADLGALTAIRAIKVGKTVAEAVEIGIKRIKQALKDKGISKWDEENDYRNELTKTLEEEGVSLKKVKDKPIYNEDGSVSIPNQMIRYLVSKGYTDIESLTDEVYKEVVKELPEITKREVRDYITKYGKEVNPTKDEIEIKINQAKRIGRLLSELEDLQKRKVRSKKGLPLRLTEREKGLKRQIRALAKDLVPKEELSDVEKIAAAKERVKNRISELNRRIRNKDFAKPKKVIKPTDEELNKLMAEKERLQEEFETEQYRLEIKNRGFWKKAEDWLMELTNGLVRGLVASFDLSAGFVQGVWRLFTNPVKSLNAFGQMFKHLVSEKNAQEYLDKIKASPYYPLIKASKLAIDDKSGKVSVKEGFFISNWVNFIWDKVISSILGFGTKSGINFFRKVNPYAASQRAFDGYVNSIRVQSFIELAKALEKEGMTYESNPKDFEKAADFVNTTTGRGGLGQADSSSRWLNIFLFAPRKVISEVKLFTPYAFAYYARMPKSVRKRALANFIKFTSLYFTTNALLWAARKDWDEDDEDDNFWNPNSSDFLTHKINNKRISIGGGMKSILTFQSRLFSGKYTDQYGQTSNLGERYGKTVNTRLDLVWRYILGKASPAVSVAAKKLDEKKGVEVDDAEIIKNLTVPIWLQDLKELYKDNPTEVNAFLTMMAILGANTRTVKKEYKIPTKIEIEGVGVELNSEQQEFLEAEIERKRDIYMEKAKSNRDYENLSDKRKFEISDEINKKAVKEAEQLLIKDRRYKTFFKQKAKQIKEEEKSKKELKEQEKDFINKIIK